MASDLIGLRLPAHLKEKLIKLYPDPIYRNNVLRALIQQLLDGKISVKKYEIPLNR